MGPAVTRSNWFGPAYTVVCEVPPHTGAYTLTYREPNQKLEFDSAGTLSADKDRKAALSTCGLTKHFAMT